MSIALPGELGFRMPAEWEPHEATWLAWPHNQEDWPGRFEPIPWVYAEVVRRLSIVEKVRILVKDADAQEAARVILATAGAEMPAVEFHIQPTDRVWTRDFAPLFVRHAAGETAAIKWRFNGWAKYSNHHNDEVAGHRIAEISGVRKWTPNNVLEGGSIDVNGAGLLLTTEECLLSQEQARNPEMSRPQVQTALAEYLGIERVLWLQNGISGDDTHGHIDDLARFTDRESIVIAALKALVDEGVVDVAVLRAAVKKYGREEHLEALGAWCR